MDWGVPQNRFFFRPLNLSSLSSGFFPSPTAHLSFSFHFSTNLRRRTYPSHLPTPSLIDLLRVLECLIDSKLRGKCLFLQYVCVFELRFLLCFKILKILCSISQLGVSSKSFSFFSLLWWWLELIKSISTKLGYYYFDLIHFLFLILLFPIWVSSLLPSVSFYY